MLSFSHLIAARNQQDVLYGNLAVHERERLRRKLKASLQSRLQAMAYNLLEVNVQWQLAEAVAPSLEPPGKTTTTAQETKVRDAGPVGA